MRILLFGASGSAGGAVLDHCLRSPDVDDVIAIARRPIARGATQRLRVIVHENFADYTDIASVFENIDACLFCLGKSSTQIKSEQEYTIITHDFALAAARMLKEKSPRSAFHYISGTGTRIDSKQMWSRVKARTENELMELVGAICWRPAFIDGNPSQSEPRLFTVLKPVFRLFKPFKSLYCSGADLAEAMLRTTKQGVRSQVYGSADIRSIAGNTVVKDLM